MLNVRNTNSLVDTTSDSEELGFCGSDVNHMVNHFDDWLIVWVDMWYWGGNIISYTCVQNNDYGMVIIKSIDSDVVKITYIILDIMSSDMEGEAIWEWVYESILWRKLYWKEKK